MIPKTTQPLTKFIRTLEGLVVVAANVALVVVPIVTSSLTATQAVRWGVILDSVVVVSRSVLKAVAAVAPAPPPAPEPLNKFEQLVKMPSPPPAPVDKEGWPT